MVDVIPGFAGMYYEKDGTPVVRLVARSQGQADATHARNFAKSHPWRLGEEPRDVRFLPAKYDFRQLRDWHDRAFMLVASVPGLAYTTVDVVANTVTLAVSTEAGLANVRALIKSLSIPDDAVSTPVVAPFRFQTDLYLDDALRPATAGTLINTYVGNCTLGFSTQKVRYLPGYYNGSGPYDFTHYFVTASHCMSTPGVSTQTQVTQAPYFDPYYTIGYESRQPPWDFSSYSNCPTSHCSLADAALIRYSGDNGNMAAIARTTGPNTGSTTLDPFGSVFTISDSTNNSGAMMQGTLVSKVGARSGWTTGYITGSCFNQPAFWPGYYLLCQDSYSASNADGDSGGPIFRVDLSGQYAEIVGLHWGGNGSTGAFSPYSYVRYELTRADYSNVCGSYGNCWLGLSVSGSWVGGFDPPPGGGGGGGGGDCTGDGCLQYSKTHGQKPIGQITANSRPRPSPPRRFGKSDLRR